jgi:hypothetical protein
MVLKLHIADASLTPFNYKVMKIKVKRQMKKKKLRKKRRKRRKKRRKRRKNRRKRKKRPKLHLNRNAKISRISSNKKKI